jgi:uncharacterized protein with von Willebrand factor type A (vWA) domain
LFNALYKNSPESREQKEVKTRFWPNFPFVEKMKEMPEYQKLRSYTRLNDFESMVAMKAFLQEMVENLTEEEQDALNAGDGADGAEQQVDDLEERQEQIKCQLDKNPGDEGLQGQNKINEQALKQAQENLQNIQGQIHQKSHDMADQMTDKIQQALQNASDDTEQASDMIRGWGQGAGNIQKMPYAEKMRIAEILTQRPRIKQLMKVMGRLKRLMASKQSAKLKKSFTEYMDVEQGDNIERMLPSELIMLMAEETETLFHRRFVEKQILQYRLEGKEPAGKGPIVCLIDSSGSISQEDDTWEKGIALALLDLCMKQKRHFSCVIFSHDPSQAKQIDFEPNDPDLVSKVIEMAEYYIGGGTDFQHPVDMGVEYIEKNEHFKNADLILLSDGYCNVGDEWMDEFKSTKERLDFKFWSICVGGGSTVLDNLCDKVITTDTLTSMETAGELFEMV